MSKMFYLDTLENKRNIVVIFAKQHRNILAFRKIIPKFGDADKIFVRLLTSANCTSSSAVK